MIISIDIHSKSEETAWIRRRSQFMLRVQRLVMRFLPRVGVGGSGSVEKPGYMRSKGWLSSASLKSCAAPDRKLADSIDR